MNNILICNSLAFIFKPVQPDNACKYLPLAQPDCNFKLYELEYGLIQQVRHTCYTLIKKRHTATEEG